MPSRERKRTLISKPRQPVVAFGRGICGLLRAAERREWLVTNAIGGFASGTVAGSLTRRYHGLLFAALNPPLGRTLLVTKLDELVEYDGEEHELFTNRWRDDVIAPEGYYYTESFHLEHLAPTWRFAFGDALLEKRIWMEQGKNTTYVRYNLLRAINPVTLTLKALVNYRDFHDTTKADSWKFECEKLKHGRKFVAFEGATPFYLLSPTATFRDSHVWVHNFNLKLERNRGLADLEDHLHVGNFTVELTEGDSVTIVASTHEDALELESSAFDRHREREENILYDFKVHGGGSSRTTPAWIKQLVLAADQFVVSRPTRDDPDGKSIIAGYPWFSDWGRATMVSLTGLTLTTGRPHIARRILKTFSEYVDRGMLPNHFPDEGELPEYNTVDASLWYFEALRQYIERTADMDLLFELYPILVGIIDWYIKGTRFRIKVDREDGLLFAGEDGMPVTWMDARAGDWVVTPRIGKAVEVNALWLNALNSMTEFSNKLGEKPDMYIERRDKCAASFSKFWNEADGCCFDVIDTPAGKDASIRPNQIFAVALPFSPLTKEQQRKVVSVCARQLLTSYGLRTLAPGEPNYFGKYTGPEGSRASAYHQGTAWGWLLGPFVQAHLRVFKDRVTAMSFLEPIAHQLRGSGLGKVSELFDGDPPYWPRGCISQAWSVGEILRAWEVLHSRKSTRRSARSAKPGR